MNIKTIIPIILTSILILSSGCIIDDILMPSPTYNFPADISGMCHHVKNEAQQGIERIDGKPLTIKRNLKVKKIPGAKKTDGIWAWQSDYWDKMWVRGLCHGNLIEIACNPTTGGEVSSGVLKHEMGHYWIMNNHKIYGHPKKYDPIFNWSWIDDYINNRDPFKKPTPLEDGDTFSLHGIDSNGIPYSIDFIYLD